MTKSKINPVEFTNSIGQGIKPGDEIAIITTGRANRVYIRTGQYLGLDDNKNVKAVSNREVSYWAFRGTETEVHYKDPFWSRLRGLPRNSDERKSVMLEVELKKKNVPFNTTLQLNRIFKIDTLATEIKL